MATESIARNLRYLCARQKSVSQVCRHLGFNRQQFGRYLSGTNRPSVHNLTRICRYFSISIDEIVLPHEQFREYVAAPPTESGQAIFPAPILDEFLRISTAAATNLDDYIGYHVRYQYAFAFPGYIFKSLVSVQKIGGYYCTKQIERIPKSSTPTDPSLIFKHHGLLLGLCSRIFLIEHEASVQGAITQTVYAPIIRSGRRIMSGVCCSISSTSDSNPTAARSVLESLGSNADPSKALRKCGLFRPDSDAIAPYIATLIDNQIRDNEFTLKAHRG